VVVAEQRKGKLLVVRQRWGWWGHGRFGCGLRISLRLCRRSCKYQVVDLRKRNRRRENRFHFQHRCCWWQMKQCVCAPEEGGVAVGGGDRHGGCVSDSDSYGVPCRLVYRGRSTAGNY